VLALCCSCNTLVQINVNIPHCEICRLDQLDCGYQFIHCPLVCDGMFVQFRFRVAQRLFIRDIRVHVCIVDGVLARVVRVPRAEVGYGKMLTTKSCEKGPSVSHKL
jgi:hypothetical protein